MAMVISFFQTNALDVGMTYFTVDHMLLCQTDTKNRMNKYLSLLLHLSDFGKVLFSLELIITFMILPDFTTF